MTSAPNRARSNREEAVAINSIPQQAVANGIGHRLFDRAQLAAASSVVMKMLPVLQRIWLQMPEPKWCISMGACACTGGVFDTYAVVQGVDRFMPVDLYVPGCPPRPEQLMAGIIALQDKIKHGGTLNGTEFAKRTQPMGPTPYDLDELIRIREANEQLVSLN